MRLLVRLYPRPWRARYGAELEALLEQTPATPSAVLDLLRGAAAARLTCPRRFSPGRFVKFALIGLLVQPAPLELWDVSRASTFFSAGAGTGAIVLALLVGLVGAFPPSRQTGLRPR